jgi:hypothetical protein
MCPFCLATVGLIVAGTASTGGMAALAVRLVRKNKSKEITSNPNERRNENVNDQESENSIAR